MCVSSFLVGNAQPDNSSLHWVVGRELPASSSDNCPILISLDGVSLPKNKVNDIFARSDVTFLR